MSIRNPIDCLTKHAPHLIDSFNKTEGKDIAAATGLALKEFEALHKELEQFKKSINPKYKPKEFISPDKSDVVKKIQDEYNEKIQSVKDEKETKISDTKEEGSVTEPMVSEGVPETKEGEGKEPPKEPTVELPLEEDLPERRFTKQMLRSDELSTESKAEISKTLNYIRETDAMSVKEANEIIDKVGVDEAQNIVMNDTNVKGKVRVTLGQIIIKKYDELAQNTKDIGERDFYLDKAIQTATFVTEKLATEPGQTIQAFSMWARLSPEGQLRAANQDMARQGKEKLRRREKDIDVIGKKFQKANEEAVEEVVKSELKIEQETPSKGKLKIEKAKQKRAAIIKKYQQNKGRNLYSAPGLTKEGIEFVGEMAKTYIEEGVANVEVLVEKIIKHLEELTGKKVEDDVRKQIVSESDRVLNKSDVSLIGESLKDKNIKIANVVKKHYTVADKVKKSLAQKLMDEADMSESNAASLAKKVEDAFDRVATRKKRNILYNEKARFDKINKTLQGQKKTEQKTVSDEIIKYSNLGAFEGKEFLDMMANKFGLSELTPEQAAKLLELSKKVQKSPEGSPKNNATEDLLAYRANLMGKNIGETAQAVWYANILSGYRTHEKNLISTFFNSMGELAAEMGKDPKSIPYLVAGYVKGLAKRGAVEAAHTLKTGYSPIHIKKIETPGALERQKFIGGAINPANWFKYVMRMMVAEDVLSFQGLKEARAYQLARRYAQSEGLNTWSKKGWDRVNEILLHTKERWREAELQAEEEGITGKLEKRRRIYELMEESRPEKMTEDAYGFAAHGTFNHESEGSLGAITNAVASALDAVDVAGVKPGRLVIPFTRIITNVVNNSLDYTPVAFVRAARGVRGFRSFEGNRFTKGAFKELSKEERQRLIAKASLGIVLSGTLQAMHQAGIIQITGGGTGDNKKDEQLRESGWQEYSIKIGNKYYSYKYTPLVFNLGFLGNMNDQAEYGKEDKKTLDKQMQVAASRIGGQMADMTWINSASTFLGALTEPNVDRQTSAVNKSLAGMASGFIPFKGAVTQATQALEGAFNMNKKQTEGAWQALVSSIPIARNSFNDKINALGDPIKTDTDVIISSEKQDPVWKFLLDHKGWVAPVNPKTLITFDQKTGEDRPLTMDEYYDFSVKRGKKIRAKLEELMKVGKLIDWNTGNEISVDKMWESQFNKWLSKIEKEATKETKAEMFGEAPEKPVEDLDISQ